MTFHNYLPHLAKNEVEILVPYKNAQDALVNDLFDHLYNYHFDVRIIPCDIGCILTTIHQSTDRRLEILGALAYYKIKGMEYKFAIEQDNHTLFMNRLFE